MASSSLLEEHRLVVGLRLGVHVWSFREVRVAALEQAVSTTSSAGYYLSYAIVMAQITHYGRATVLDTAGDR
jgi:hypothetical protein